MKRFPAVALCLMLLLGQPAPAQSPAVSPTAAPPTPIPVAEVPQRADETLARIRELTELADRSEVERIDSAVPAIASEIDSLRRDPRGQPDATITLRELDDLRERWRRIKDDLGRWTQTLAERSRLIDDRLAELRMLADLWAQTDHQAAREGVPDALRERIRAARHGIRTAQESLRERRERLLSVQAAVSQRTAIVAEQLALLAGESARVRQGLLVRDSAPLWQSWAHAPGDAWRAMGQNAVDNLADVVRYAADEPGRVSAHLVVFVGLWLAALIARPGVAGAGGDATLATVRWLLARPLSTATVIAVLLARFLHPKAPAAVVTLGLLLGIVPLYRLLRIGVFAALPAVPVAFVVLLAVQATHDLLPPFSPLARTLLLLIDLAVVIGLGWQLRQRHLDRLELPARWRRTLGGIATALVGVMAFAAAANLAGYVLLAMLVSEAALAAISTGIAAYVVTLVLNGVVLLVLDAPFARAVRAVDYHRRALHRWSAVAIRIAAIAFWGATVLHRLALLEGAIGVVQAVLAAPLEVGTLHISLGDVLALGITLWIAVVLARITRSLLEDDVLPRLALPRGVPVAISTSASYVIVFLGVLAAFSAAGVDFGRLTVLLGALGVGLSFGLQNVVNNFVSGLILLAERPIQIGDMIDIEGVSGQVQRIGIRSSTIRTMDGAEVIVPNGNLLSQKLVNWTLSDRLRRIEITVGVAYGSDPERVVTLLTNVARQHPAIIPQPEPIVSFLGFGESSLDFALRAWTQGTAQFGQVRSELGLAVYRALREAAIEIPFPQRDVHVHAEPRRTRNSTSEES
jgi:small-conductance mechanosensitive channel